MGRAHAERGDVRIAKPLLIVSALLAAGTMGCRSRLAGVAFARPFAEGSDTKELQAFAGLDPFDANADLFQKDAALFEFMKRAHSH